MLCINRDLIEPKQFCCIEKAFKAERWHHWTLKVPLSLCVPQLADPGAQRVGEGGDVVLAPPQQQEEEGAGQPQDAVLNRPEDPGVVHQQQGQDPEVVDFWAPRQYGPKAVLKPGVLGNYEPVIKPAGGPGEGTYSRAH